MPHFGCVRVLVANDVDVEFLFFTHYYMAQRLCLPIMKRKRGLADSGKGDSPHLLEEHPLFRYSNSLLLYFSASLSFPSLLNGANNLFEFNYFVTHVPSLKQQRE